MTDYEHLNQYWAETIICHPEAEKYCRWETINSDGWYKILQLHPEFICHAPQKITISFMSIEQWLDLLLLHPELGSYLPDKKGLLNKKSAGIGAKWAELLACHPEFARFNVWKNLRRKEWAMVLRQQPQFLDYYMKERALGSADATMFSDDIASIVIMHPELFDRFSGTHFSDSERANILLNHPEFCDRYNLNDMDAEKLSMLLAHYPEWVSKCDFSLRNPYEILRIAEKIPDILNHYNLERFKDVEGDAPWIEVYPRLIPYTSWDFSYNYWDLLLTRLSSWLNSEKYQEVSSFVTSIKRPLREYKVEYGATGYSEYPPGERPPLVQPGRYTLRNSLDSIMELRYQMECRNEEVNSSVYNPYIRQIVNDDSSSYEQLMIKLSMMSAEEQRQVIQELFAKGKINPLNWIMEMEPKRLMNVISKDVLFPWMLMHGTPAALHKYLKIIGREYLAGFRDAGGNNALHYAFFHCPWRPKIQADEQEAHLFQELQDAGVNPDAPNEMGYSYRQICEALEKYLLAAKINHRGKG